MVGTYKQPLKVNGRMVYSIGLARIELTKLVNVAHTQGVVSIIHSKGRQAAIVPISIMHELDALRAKRDAGTLGQDEPRTYSEDAHSLPHQPPPPLPREVMRQAYLEAGPYVEPAQPAPKCSAFGPMAPLKDDDDGR